MKLVALSRLPTGKKDFSPPQRSEGRVTVSLGALSIPKAMGKSRPMGKLAYRRQSGIPPKHGPPAFGIDRQASSAGIRGTGEKPHCRQRSPACVSGKPPRCKERR